jgi:hypothetical protein
LGPAVCSIVITISFFYRTLPAKEVAALYWENAAG